LDGVKDGFLINPLVVDVRTGITTKLLSEEGYTVLAITEDEENAEQMFYQKDFEKKFSFGSINRAFCDSFLKKCVARSRSGQRRNRQNNRIRGEPETCDQDHPNVQ
jgi:type I restriction enzyme R subunit